LDRLVIEGGVPLVGEVFLDGAKNAALPALAAGLLAEQQAVTLMNVPRVVDIRTMCKFLEHMGVTLNVNEHSIEIHSRDINRLEAPYDLVRTMRASILVLGPLLARYGYAKVSFPGGCAIGARPVNLHLEGFKAMGASINLQGGYIEARANRLKGADIRLEVPTVTGTENLMMAAALAQGCTIIEHAAREPEVVDLADLLNSMGARIRGAGTSRIEIEGVTRLEGTSHTIIPDRIETATYAVAAAITGGDLTLLGARRDQFTAVAERLLDAGVTILSGPDWLRVVSEGPLRSVDVTTAPYPGFPTDVQAQFMALMCLGNGTSHIRETVFENRFMHVAELRRMGADIRCRGSVAKVRGVTFLQGAPVMATDLRASASLILAGLVARGTTHVNRIYHLDRGYSRIEEKLSRVGARVRREKV
jgi:UDP-N-acetylglucosamine 1-carboxyvinyltransferase